MSFFMRLNREEYTGKVEVSWKDGIPQHTRTESSRLPDELPSADADLAGLLSKARGDEEAA